MKQTQTEQTTQSCGSCCHTATKWYKERLFITAIFIIALYILSFIIAPLHPFSQSFTFYLSLTLIPITIGLLIGGIIDFFIPKEYIEKYLSRHNKKTIIYAIIFGFLMTACCHGILAIAMELYKKGASTSSVVAFLLASPWANLPMTILLFGFFGIKSLFIIGASLLIAFTTGIIFLQLEKRNLVECDKCATGKDIPIHTDFSIKKDIKKRITNFEYTSKNIGDSIKGTLSGSWSLSKMILWWILIGMTVAAFADAYIPTHLFVTYMGPTALGLIITLLLASIIEVCSEGSSPLAFQIYNKTGALGNSFTFLMAGVATDYTEIGLIWHTIGKKAALWIPIITIPQILILSFIFNIF